MNSPRLITLIATCLMLMLPSPARAQPTLTLTVPPDQLPLQIGDVVRVELHMSGLDEPAAGFQAFLEYDPAYLQFLLGSYTLDPFGLPVIVPILATDNQIDLAAGVNQLVGQSPTTEDALLAVFFFEMVQDGCPISLHFRSAMPPTRITNAAGQPLEPLMLISLPAGPPTADLTGDDMVNVFDLLELLGEWGACQEPLCAPDLTCDGTVNVFDLLELLSQWGPVSP